MSGLPPGYNGEYRLSRDPKVQREILNGSWRDGRPQRYRRNPCFEGVNAEIIRKGQKLIDETQVRADYYRDEAAIEREQRIRKEAKYKNAILKAEQRGEARGRAHGYQRAVDEQELFDTGFRTAMDLNRRKSVKTAYGGGRSQKVSISRSSSISRSRHGPPSNENPRRHQHGDRMGQPACSRGFERPLKDYSVASLKDAASAHHKDPTNTNDHHNRRESRKPSYHTGSEICPQPVSRSRQRFKAYDEEPSNDLLAGTPASSAETVRPYSSSKIRPESSVSNALSRLRLSSDATVRP